MEGLKPLLRYFDFKGRSGRAEYWQFAGLTVIVSWLIAILDGSARIYEGVSSLSILWAVASFIPQTAVGFRRLHDRGKSGWLYVVILTLAVVSGALVGLSMSLGPDGILIGQISLVGIVGTLAAAIYLFVQLALPGDVGRNAYGPVPIPGMPPSSSPQAMTKEDSRAAAAESRMQADPLSQIERLSKLRDDGAITEAEFAAQKSTLLLRL